MIHKYTSHHLRGDTEEVCAILPVDPRLIHQPHVGLMHEGSRLQRVIGAFATQVVGRQATQLIVDEREQRVNGFMVAASELD